MSKRQGVCGACGVAGTLQTYSTAQFFHLYLIPLIPVGHQRIIDYCPNCKRCISVSTKEMKKVLSNGPQVNNDPVFAAAAEQNNDMHLMNGQQLLKKKRYFSIPLFIPYLVPLGILFAILSIFGIKTHAATKNRMIWLVNGTEVPYSVTIDETLYRTTPYSKRKIPVGMGDHNVEVSGTGFPVESFSFSYRAPWMSRIYDKKTLILNPDATAVMYTAMIPYLSENSRHEPEVATHYHLGKQWYVLGETDYEFCSSPSTLSVSEGRSVRYVSELSLYKPETPLALLEVCSEQGSKDDLSGIAANVIRYNPETKNSALLLSFSCGTNDVLKSDLLIRGLARRPILTEWHRFYQSSRQFIDPGHDLVEEYEQLLRAEPKSQAIAYLLGRLISDEDRARQLFLQSEQGDECPGYGYHAIAYNLLCQGQFSQALNYALKADERSPGNGNFRAVLMESKLANKQYEELLFAVQQECCKQPESGDLTAEKINYLLLLDRAEEAKTVGARYLKQAQDWMALEYQKQWRAHFASLKAYLDGDMDKYIELQKDVNVDLSAYMQALQSSDGPAVLEAVKSSSDISLASYLSAYCAAKHGGDNAAADEIIDVALLALPNQAGLLGCLAGENVMIPEDLQEIDMLPADKKLLAAALALHYPAMQKEFKQVALKFNYDPQYPHHLVERWMKTL